MKANFPAEYMCAVLTAESGDTETIATMIGECKRMKIPVLPPDINASVADFTVVKGETETEDQIRFGLYTIKNLGEAISDAIITEREANGHYRSFTEFLERVTHKDLNKKSMEALIKAGAFDSFGEDRGALLHNLDDALEYHKAHAREKESSQVSLFAAVSETARLPSFRMRPAPEASKDDMLRWEKELLGLYISGHPLEKHREKMEKAGVNIKNLAANGYEGTNTVLAGIIEEVRIVITKKNEHMAFVKVADFTGAIEVVFFPRTYTECKEQIVLDRCIAVKGRFSRRNDSPSVVAENVKAL
jgi:DNA polymerase-3 subunit alpha